MPKLEYQVLSKDIENPVCIAYFFNNGMWSCKKVTREADELRKQLNKAKIKFAAIDHNPPIEIIINKEDVKKVEKMEAAGKIDLPTAK